MKKGCTFGGVLAMTGGSKASYSRRKRDRMDYRSEYFKHNPGIFGCIWSCAYCHRPLIGKSSVVVDHIIPLNSVFGMNARYNLVASCQRCNSRKSDKVDARVVVGYTSKLLETIVFTVQKAAVIVLVGVWVCLKGLVSMALRMLAVPLRNGSVKVKVAYVVVCVAALCFFLSRV